MVARRWLGAGVVLAIACGRGPFLVGEGSSEAGDGAHDDAGDDGLDEGASGDGGCDVDLDSHERDCDMDGIPDGDDPFPTDAARPGRARSDVIYAHSPSQLYTVEVHGGSPPDVQPVGAFAFDDGATWQVTDIAIDRFGVLYAVTFGELFACDPGSAKCWSLADFATNSLAFLPIGVLDGVDDTLVTLAGASWMVLALRGPEVTPKAIGDVGGGYSSSGDVVATRAGLTVFTSPSSAGNVLVALDPASGQVLGELGSTADTFNPYGLAAVKNDVWIFDDGAAIQRFDPATGEVGIVGSGPEPWWGAAAHPDALR